MPELELTQKIEFNVDQMTIDRVEALAAIDGLDLHAWFRRLVDDLIAQSSRHMGIDHVEVAEVRKSVFDIINWIADAVHPLRSKARALIDSGLSFIGAAKKPADEVAEPETKKKRGIKVKQKLEAIKEKVLPTKEPEPEPVVEAITVEAPAPEPEVEIEEALEVIEDAMVEIEEEKSEKEKEIERLKAALEELEKA